MTFPTEAEAYKFLRQMPLTTAVVIPTTHGHWVITSPTGSMQPAKICSICHEPFREFPCNALPVASGHCCAYCDDHAVTPARIRLAQERPPHRKGHRRPS